MHFIVGHTFRITGSAVTPSLKTVSVVKTTPRVEGNWEHGQTYQIYYIKRPREEGKPFLYTFMGPRGRFDKEFATSKEADALIARLSGARLQEYKPIS